MHNTNQEESLDAGLVESLHFPQELFQALFRNTELVRAQIDWNMVSELSVTLEIRDSIPSDWYTVWYSSGVGRDCSPKKYDEYNAIPLTVGEASSLSNAIEVSRINAIQALVEDFSKRNLAVFSVIAWRTPSGRTVLLDGNHRAVASLIARGKSSISVFVIHGGSSGIAVPDLIHHP